MPDASNLSHITNDLYPLVIPLALQQKPLGLGVIPKPSFPPLACVWIAWKGTSYAESIWDFCFIVIASESLVQMKTDMEGYETMCST